MYIKGNDKHCQKIMQERINKGHSKVYPDKPMYFEGFDPYGKFFTTIFLIKICCVYFPLSNEYKDLAPEKFDELLKIYRNSEHAMKSEAKKLKNHGFSVSNYGDSNELEVLIDDLYIDITAKDYSANQLSDFIYDALDTLSAVQSEIITGLFFKGKTQTELAEELGCTQSTVSYQKDKAIKLMTQYFKNHGYEAEDFEL